MPRHPTDFEHARLMEVKNRLIGGMQREIEAGEVSKQEILCLFAHVTGMLIAMQDQREMTASDAMEIVSLNIVAGNEVVLLELLKGDGGNA